MPSFPEHLRARGRLANGASLALVIATVLSAPRALAQTMPARSLGKIIATSATPFGGVSGVHVLSNGNVEVDDPVKKMLVLLDPGLHTTKTILSDDGSATHRYLQGGTLIPDGPDSSFRIDRATGSVLVIGPNGGIARVGANPLSDKALTGIGQYVIFGARTDPHDRIIFIGPQTSLRPFASLDAVYSARDSAPILRLDPARVVDTIGFIQMPPSSSVRVGETAEIYVNPMPVKDLWAVLHDGSVLVVHAENFHVDWIREPRTPASTLTLPYDWVRLSDSAKAALLAAAESTWYAVPAGERPGGELLHPDPSRLTDYRRPMTGGRAPGLVDDDDHLWIPLGHPAPGAGREYYIADKLKGLVDRVQLLPGFDVVGFGKDVVYETLRTGEGIELVMVRSR